MGLSPSGGRYGGGGIVGGGDLRLPPLEHSCTVYCGQAHYVLMSGSRSEAKVKGDQALMESGRAGFGGDADGGLGGVTYGGVGEGGWDGYGEGLIWWEDNVTYVYLVTQLNFPLVYAP